MRTHKKIRTCSHKIANNCSQRLKIGSLEPQNDSVVFDNFLRKRNRALYAKINNAKTTHDTPVGAISRKSLAQVHFRFYQTRSQIFSKILKNPKNMFLR